MSSIFKPISQWKAGTLDILKTGISVGKKISFEQQTGDV